MIPYARQYIDKRDINSVNRVLKSKFLTQGPETIKFEKKLSRFCGSKFAVSVNSATSALHLSCLALGVKKNDYVWTSPVSFVASANCALLCGAKIDFVDIDLNTVNISTELLEKKLKTSQANNKLPKILIVVHFGGTSCDMKKIYQLSKIYKFKIIEDASHALGGKYKKKFIGNCEYSDLCVFSFHPVKIITSSEGGAVLTNNKNIAKKITILRSHGIERKTKKINLNKNEIYNYDQKYLGINYRMSDLSAALGNSQLDKAIKFVDKRNKIAQYYYKKLSSLPINFQEINKDIKSSYHLFIIRLDLKKIKLNKNKIYNNLIKNGINVNIHYIPIYKHSFFQKLGFSKTYCHNAEIYFKQTITIPLYFSLTIAQIDKIIKILKKTINH
ncbi:MAG: UDP-4-amino-4,6-dideoxy-N-acetyl-beta-L-altrosamine transaminase [Candidatus Endolissoclinum sp. TMED37]|nr:MAG: UDP-4-amino-4,6-dideoxy-N-acetyl-beta-L-altrosamine transaminase [Candidatus Endolissoclinum sp. TMED37]|tara:strand:- start:332 stop:1492 length:1161 start_codon:yes stop_codon:yes gene_type:complete